MKLLILLIGLCIAMLFSYLQWMNSSASQREGDLLQVFPMVKDRYSLVMFGDYGTGSPDQQKLFEALESYCLEYGIDAIFLLGDNIYMDGVASPRDPKWKQVIEDPFSRLCISKVPLYPILGNHDYKGNPDAQISYSRMNSQWNFPNRFYSVKFGDVLEVIALDTSYLDYCGDQDKCALDFLLQRKSKSLAKWKMAIGHHPAISSSSKHKNDFLGMALKYFTCDLNAYIAAHSHHLEHLNDQSCLADYFISGAGGAHLYPVHQQRMESNFAKASFGFLAFDIMSRGVDYRFYDTKGKVLYRHSPFAVAHQQDELPEDSLPL